MPNTNGLTSLAPVYVTGAADSNIWASRIAPTVVDPLIIKSADGGSSAVVGCNNNGNMIMYPTNPAGAIYVQGTSGLFINSPNNNQVLQLASENDGDAAVYQTGGSTLYLGRAGVIAFQNLSTAPSLIVGAGQGRIYDSVYNPVASISVLNNNTTGNISYDNTATIAAGVYQLQLSVESPVATGTSTNFLEMYVTLPPSTSVVNFSGNEIAPGAVGTNLLQLNSGYFTHPGGSMRIEVGASTTPWTGTWSLQLVKIG